MSRQRKEIRYGGYTNTPSDYECVDGDLAGIINMVPEDNGLVPIPEPTGIFVLPDGDDIAGIHKVSDPATHYIILDGNNLKWLDEADLPADPEDIEDLLQPIHDFGQATVGKVQVVGNTLVVLASDGVHYILWKDGSYNYLGQKIPELLFQFGLNTEMTCYPKDKDTGGGHFEIAKRAKTKIKVNGSENAMPFVDDDNAHVLPRDVWETSPFIVPEDWENAFTYSLEGVEGLPTMSAVIGHMTNFAMGNMNKLVAEAMKEHKFTQPFLVRWAYELYDGSHVMHGDPVLMIPSSKYPFFAMDMDGDGFRVKDTHNDNRNIHLEGRAYGFAGTLMARLINTQQTLTALSNWKDIVKGVDIYVSAPIYTYNQAGKVYGWTNMDDEGAWDDYYTYGATQWTGHTDNGQHSFEDIFKLWNAASDPSDISKRYYIGYDNNHPMPNYILTTPEKNKEDVHKNLEASSFYKVASYEVDSSDLLNLYVGEAAVKIDDGVLESLLARQTLEDDYHSRDTLTAQYSYSYNGRLNLAGITRSLHAPLAPSVAWEKDNHQNRTWTLMVEVKTGSTTHLVATSGDNGTDFPRYIFYPDREATRAWLSYTSGGTTHTWLLTLTEHPYLEGAYWYGGLAKEISETETDDDLPDPPIAGSNAVMEPNKIYTSAVNNPFVFPLLGINTVGTGTILGICSTVVALSQGQFGDFPLYAFTDEGVWALKANNEGAYIAVQPVTRDVCNNPDSITQLDDSVLFTTDRGLMLLSGSTTQCISTNIDGEDIFDPSTLPGLSGLVGGGMDYVPLKDFLNGGKMLYDYVNQRIIVYNPDHDYAYVYSLESKKWGVQGISLADGVNAYPDAIAVDQDGNVVNMSDDDDGDPLTGVHGVIVTRPLKLDYPNDLKTVDTVIQRGYFNFADQTREVKPIRSILYGSRDLFHWNLVWSSEDHIMRGFGGTPFKYFRLAILCELRRNEKIVGCTVQYRPRLSNQPR